MMVELRCGEAVVGGSIKLAKTFTSRFLGLMFVKDLPQGSGLLLAPCGSIHMCFMCMALDVVYLDDEYRVLAIERSLKPWRLGKTVKGARMVLEAPVGTIDRCGISPGLTLLAG